jgi:hypothetical protein
MPASLRGVAFAEPHAHLGTAKEHKRAGSGLAIDTYSSHLAWASQPTSNTASGYKWKANDDHKACGTCTDSCAAV